MSLPVRGAWIEIADASEINPNGWGRSPCGERGLKFCQFWQKGKNKPSLPVRGAWIEILKKVNLMANNPSLPVRGAWIEIKGRSPVLGLEKRRSPCGERGLKFNAYETINRNRGAPRAGSVD